MRRVRRPSLVVTFATTAAAMAFEEACGARGLPGRMIPVPGQVRAGCGLAWKASVDARDALESSGLVFEAMAVVELLEFEP